MNENFLQSLEDKCHRMLNAVEPGTVVAIFVVANLGAGNYTANLRFECEEGPFVEHEIDGIMEVNK